MPRWQLIVQLTTDSCALAFDTFIFVMTLGKTYHHVRELRRLGRTGIAVVLLRDGECRLLHSIISLVLEITRFAHSPDLFRYLLLHVSSSSDIFRAPRNADNVYQSSSLVFLITVVDMSLHIVCLHSKILSLNIASNDLRIRCRSQLPTSMWVGLCHLVVADSIFLYRIGIERCIQLHIYTLFFL